VVCWLNAGNAQIRNIADFMIVSLLWGESKWNAKLVG
jgi:hypothetical protein